jgi:DNA topoisomerase-1
VTDVRRGIRRIRSGRGFRYVDARGRPVRDPRTLRRIRSLAVPPAWTDVWICPDPNGHIQATGRDARGRKQYRYHPRWRTTRDETKFGRMIFFAEALPRIRARVARDLAQHGLSRERVLAAVVRLLERTLARVGNQEYAHANHSYGLTTLRTRHVGVTGARIRFRFRGKAGVPFTTELTDARLARIVKRCRDLPGQELFQYVGETGRPHAVGSADVNAYLREIAGDDFTAKDFRTWAGTVAAALALEAAEKCTSETQAKRNVVRAIEATAKRLGNTAAVCRKAYVHPDVIAAYLDGETIHALVDRATRVRSAGLEPEESAVLALLRRRLSAEATRRAS